MLYPTYEIGDRTRVKFNSDPYQMFDDELELAYAVIDGIDARAQAHGYIAERFRFPSKLDTS